MKFELILCLSITLAIAGTHATLHKVDNLFSYRTSDLKNPIPHKSDRNLILGFGMSDDEKAEERRREDRKDDVKNLIKVILIRFFNWLIYSMMILTSMYKLISNSKIVLLTVDQI